MKASEVLRKAAQMVERERAIGGCYAICESGDSQYSVNRAYGIFAKHFKGSKTGFWWTNRLGDPEATEPRNARIIGLCLAAAIAESEGD